MSARLIRFILCLVLMLPALIPARAEGDFVIVLDPGHGGRDAGALGQRTNEKSINLLVAQKLAKMLEKSMPDVKVYMTREGDRFVTLQGRADFANRKKADLFISIHANSVDAKSPARTKVNGAAVYTLGLDRSDTNLAVAMRENEVMKLEDDYNSTYEGFDPSSTESYIAFEMMQHKNMDQSIALAEAVQNQLVRTAGRKNNGVRQAPFWVLVRTSMPAILVELDFICNPTMEKFMGSDEGSSKLAQSICAGVERYRSGRPVKRPHYDIPEPKAPEKTPENVKGDPAPSPIIYKVQFLTAPKAYKKGAPELKGFKGVDSYKDGGMVKYTVGEFSSQAEAAGKLAEVKKKFPDAFIIKTRDGKRIK